MRDNDQHFIQTLNTRIIVLNSRISRMEKGIIKVDTAIIRERDLLQTFIMDLNSVYTGVPGLTPPGHEITPMPRSAIQFNLASYLREDDDIPKKMEEQWRYLKEMKSLRRDYVEENDQLDIMRYFATGQPHTETGRDGDG